MKIENRIKKEAKKGNLLFPDFPYEDNAQIKNYKNIQPE